MQVHSAMMLDEDEVADHNSPTLILAGSEQILLSKVREHVKTYPHWLNALRCNVAEVDTMSIDDMNERLAGGDGEGGDDEDWDGESNKLSIQTGCDEV